MGPKYHLPVTLEGKQTAALVDRIKVSVLKLYPTGMVGTKEEGPTLRMSG